MVGKTNVAGARLRSIIAVTYPEGSVCTCSNGKKTLTARDTSGKALFNVSTGTWTVTATDGNKTKDATVDITTEGQFEIVTLNYEVYLIQNGSVNSAFNFGNAQLRSDRSPSIYTGSGFIQYSTTSYTCGVATPSKVDLSKYSKLVMNCNVTSIGSGSVRLSVCSALNAGSESGVLSNITASKNTSSTGSQTLTLDLSKITSSLYIGLVLDAPEFNTVTVQVMNMYLE